MDESNRQVTQASVLPFSLWPVLATPVPAGLRSYGVHGDFQAFAQFEGDWLVSNRSTLFRYSKDGQLLQTWRVGLELPACPLTVLAVRRGIPQPELWVGTDGAGALIWDGKTFRQFLPKSEPIRKTSALLPLPDGRMLLGTSAAGLYITDAHQLSVFRKELRDVGITALAAGTTTEEVWIGSRAQGLWLWRAGTLNHFETELPDPQVLAIFGNKTGVWVGTVNGVAEFVDGQFHRRLADGVLVTALAENAGRLWISTVDQGVLSVDLKAHTPRPGLGFNQPARSFHAVALLPGSDGVLALGGSELRSLADGVNLLSDAGIGVTDGHISALNVDSQRRLWIGYFNRGLDILTEGHGAIPTHFEDDVLFCINRIKADETGSQLFVATANGLVLFDPNGKPRRVLRTSDGLISNHITDVLSLQTGKGSVVATNAGLTFMNGTTLSSVYAFQGLVNNHVYTLAQTGAGLLAGTLGGISLLKNSVVETSFTTANSNLSQNWITASVVVGDDVFLGTYGSGVVHLDSHNDVQGFREFSKTRVEINANAMLTTNQGVYAGTAGQGLAFLPKGGQRWRFWKAALPSLNVTALALGGGDLYIGTDNGLVRIPERDITL